MKKFFSIWLYALILNALIFALPASAKQTNLPSYYPSPNGSYTKIRLMNPATLNGPDENSAAAPFCAQTGTNPATYGTPGDGSTYINSGTMFVDKDSGLVEYCKPDGSFASVGATTITGNTNQDIYTFPAACFTRFCSGDNCAPAAGSNCFSNAETNGQYSQPFKGAYTVVATDANNGNNNTPFPNYYSGAPYFSSAAPVHSYVCCLSNQTPGNSTIYAKAGCFSTFCTSGETADGTTPVCASPTKTCSQIDHNLRDIGLPEYLPIGYDSANGDTTYTIKNTCCFSSGCYNALGAPVNCAPTPIPGPLIQVEAMADDYAYLWMPNAGLTGPADPNTKLASVFVNQGCHNILMNPDSFDDPFPLTLNALPGDQNTNLTYVYAEVTSICRCAIDFRLKVTSAPPRTTPHCQYEILDGSNGAGHNTWSDCNGGLPRTAGSNYPLEYSFTSQGVCQKNCAVNITPIAACSVADCENCSPATSCPAGQSSTCTQPASCPYTMNVGSAPCTADDGCSLIQQGQPGVHLPDGEVMMLKVLIKFWYTQN